MYAALSLLLVGSVVTKAHDIDVNKITEGWNSSQITAPREKYSSKQYDTDNHSVVVDWSLVCEELCGAGYGGLKCGNHCVKKLPNETKSFNARSVNLCPILCDYQLGGNKCICFPRPSKYVATNLNDLCEILCRKFNIRLNGCSACVTSQTTKDDVNKIKTTLSIDELDDATKTTSSPPKPDPTQTTGTDTSSTQTTVDTSSPATTTTTKQPSTTTIASTSTIDDQTSTTPNWSEVCKDLCKKGEGGVLCNCDRPPLMFKGNNSM